MLSNPQNLDLSHQDDRIGPSMYTVNEQYVKPATEGTYWEARLHRYEYESDGTAQSIAYDGDSENTPVSYGENNEEEEEEEASGDESTESESQSDVARPTFHDGDRLHRTVPPNRESVKREDNDLIDFEPPSASREAIPVAANIGAFVSTAHEVSEHIPANEHCCMLSNPQNLDIDSTVYTKIDWNSSTSIFGKCIGSEIGTHAQSAEQQGQHLQPKCDEVLSSDKNPCNVKSTVASLQGTAPANTSSVEDRSHMFQNASSFDQPIVAWNTSSVTDMSHMFKDASSCNQPTGAWNTSSVTDMSHMFEGASSFNQPVKR